MIAAVDFPGGAELQCWVDALRSDSQLSDKRMRDKEMKSKRG